MTWTDTVEKIHGFFDTICTLSFGFYDGTATAVCWGICHA